MSDTVFRAKSEDAGAVEPIPAGKETTTGAETKVEVPYTDYEAEKGHPFTVEYFGLGDTWSDPSGGFPEEISAIEEFISDKIKSGELPNSQGAVKELIKKMEKTINLNKEERSLVKVETIAAYVKFLMKADKVKFNLARYGNN